jgi:hypothetical protein
MIRATASLQRHSGLTESGLQSYACTSSINDYPINKLPRKKFHAYYDHGMWKRNREDHISAIVDLSMTVDNMPKRLLKKLTELAIAYKPEVIKQPLLNNISDLATGVSSPWLYETASLFFNELIKDVSRLGPSTSPKGSPMEIVLRWFDYDDPIQIARDPECEYVGLLASHIEDESEETRHALAARSRLTFIEMRVAREFCDHLLSQRDAPEGFSL